VSTPLSPWDALPQAHSEKVVAAVAEVLRADPTIAGLFNGGEAIILSPDPLLHIDMTPPVCVVSPLAETTAFLTGGETEQSVTVRIFILYQELRRSIAVNDKTVKAAMRLIRTALLDSYTLRVPAFYNVALVKRIAALNALDFGAVGEGANIKRIQTLEIVFEYNLEASTGNPS